MNKNIKKLIGIFLAFLIFGVPVGMSAENIEEILNPEDKISEDLYQEFDRLEAEGANLEKEKIPVWVWYKDIDQKEVDREVKEQTGLTQENLEVPFEMPSLSLINDLQSEKIGSQKQMQKYLERTKVARELENQRTDEYIIKRREISSKKYKKMSEKFIKDDLKNSHDVIFKSQYAPTIIAELTQKQILMLSKNIDIVTIDLYKKINNAPSPSFIWHAIRLR